MFYCSTKTIAEGKFDKSVFDLNACHDVVNDVLREKIYYGSRSENVSEDVRIVIIL